MMLVVKILAAVAVIYLLIVALMFVFQRSIMYVPLGVLPAPAEAGAPELRVVTLSTADGLRLASWYAPATRPDRPIIAYFHGNGGHAGMRVYKVRPFLDAGYGLMLVSYRGYGGNPGRPTQDGLLADGRAALDFLAREGVPPGRVVLLGESLGAAVAVAMAAERQVAAVMLEAPFTSAADVGQGVYPWLPVRLLIKDRFETIRLIDRIGAPLLIVHGERDRIVPVGHGRRLLAAAAEPKRAAFLPDAGHNDLSQHGLLETELAFLDGLFGYEAAESR